jgi:hypothetical protein
MSRKGPKNKDRRQRKIPVSGRARPSHLHGSTNRVSGETAQ